MVAGINMGVFGTIFVWIRWRRKNGLNWGGLFPENSVARKLVSAEKMTVEDGNRLKL